MNEAVSATHHLRLFTHDLHKQLEQTAIAQDLMSPQITFGRYVEILRTWGSAWALFESAMRDCRYASQIPLLLPTERSTRAEADLRYLAGHHTAAPSRLDQCHFQFPSPKSLSALVGVCYVTRGASLGAKVIARHLTSTLDLKEFSGAGFFSQNNEAVGWSQWMHHADALLDNEKKIEQAALAAASTFTFLLHVFRLADSE